VNLCFSSNFKHPQIKSTKCLENLFELKKCVKVKHRPDLDYPPDTAYATELVLVVVGVSSPSYSVFYILPLNLKILSKECTKQHI